MSRIDPAFAYSQARLQARYGARPRVADWSQIAATADLGALLQVLRASPLAGWTGLLGARPGVHDIERRAREEWLRRVDEVASWQPEAWRKAILWLRWIAYLPALQKLARGGRAQAWMRDDAVLGPIVAREPRDRAAALRRTALAPLARGFQPPHEMAATWTRHWRQLWPSREPGRAPIEALVRIDEPTSAACSRNYRTAPARPKRCATWSGASSSPSGGTRSRRPPPLHTSACLHSTCAGCAARSRRGPSTTYRRRHDAEAGHGELVRAPDCARGTRRHAGLPRRDRLGPAAVAQPLGIEARPARPACHAGRVRDAGAALRTLLAGREAAAAGRRAGPARSTAHGARPRARVDAGSRPADRRAREPRAAAGRQRAAGGAAAAVRVGHAAPRSCRRCRPDARRARVCGSGRGPSAVAAAVGAVAEGAARERRVPGRGGPAGRDRVAGPGTRCPQGPRGHAAGRPARGPGRGRRLSRRTARIDGATRAVRARVARRARQPAPTCRKRSANWRSPRGSSRMSPSCRSRSISRG